MSVHTTKGARNRTSRPRRRSRALAKSFLLTIRTWFLLLGLSGLVSLFGAGILSTDHNGSESAIGALANSAAETDVSDQTGRFFQPSHSSPSATHAEAQESHALPSTLQGPGLTVPQEIVDMLNQRDRDLDRREEALRGAGERLRVLKGELEQIVARYEALVATQEQQAEAKQTAEAQRKTQEEKDLLDARNQQQSHLAKMYETMPPEEAAARLERMPDRKAIEVLRLLKGKKAGAILAAVKAERAARLTEELLATP